MKILPARCAVQPRQLLLVRTGLFLCLAAGIFHADVQAQEIKRGEAEMRWSAIRALKPAYPKAAIDGSTAGIVVASILAGTDGHMETVVVLEAPDPLLAAAVRDALMRWTFQPEIHMNMAF